MATTLILGLPGSGTRDVIESVFAEHELGGAGEHVAVANSTAARLTALNGTGVAFLPECWVRAHLASGDLFALPLRDLVIEQSIRIVWRGARPTSPAARRLVDSLTE